MLASTGERDSAAGFATAGPALAHKLVETLAVQYAQGEFRQFALAAKEEFLESSGKVFDDDGELFEARLAAFMEWYLTEKPLPTGLTPVETELQTAALDDQRGRTLARLATSHHSLFDIAAVGPHNVELEDVITGARFSVHERRGTTGFQAGQVVEARLLWDESQVVFGKTFLFHPGDARETVLHLVDLALVKRESRTEIMFRLARLYLRWHRSRNMSAERAYTAL